MTGSRCGAPDPLAIGPIDMRLPTLLATALIALLPLLSRAEDKPTETPFAIGEGKLALTAPAGWKKVSPRAASSKRSSRFPRRRGTRSPAA